MTFETCDCVHARPYIVEMSLTRDVDEKDFVLAQEHLRTCRRCQTKLRELRKLRDFCRQAARVQILSPDEVEAGWQSLLSLIRSPAPVASFREFDERVERLSGRTRCQRLGESMDFRRTRPSSVDHSPRPTTSCGSGLPLVRSFDHARTRSTGLAMV